MGESEDAVRRKWMLYGLLIAVALWMILLAAFGICVIYLAAHSKGSTLGRFGLGAIGLGAVILPIALGIVVRRRRAEFTRGVQTMLQHTTNAEAPQPLWLRVLYAVVWTGMSIMWLHRALDRGSILAWVAQGLFTLAALLSIRQLIFPPNAR
jgi:hypothetical protein